VDVFQSSEVVGVIVLERCLVQLDDDADESLCSFVIGELISIAAFCLCRPQRPR